MRIALRIVGILLLAVGLIWVVWLVGGVFSQAEGFRSLGELWGPVAFHAVVTGLGMGLLGRAATAKAPG